MGYPYEVSNAAAEIQKGKKCVRVAWIDCARVLGIFFVCQLHSTAALPDSFLARCSVCMFFLLAGYFNTKVRVLLALRRSAVFLAAYAFWCALGSTLSHDGGSLSLSEIWQSVCYAPYPMWFIKYMIVLLPVGAALNYLPRIGRLVLAALLLVLAFTIEPVWEVMPLTWEKLIVNTYPTYVLFLYMAGGILREIPLADLPRKLFPGMQRFSKCAVLLGFALLCGLLVASCTISEFPILQLLYMAGIWVLLFIAYTLELSCPKTSAFIAKAGPAVILIYLCNPLLMRIFTSAYLHATGMMPPPALSYIFCVLLIVGCTVAYKALIGRSRILDALLFAR